MSEIKVSIIMPSLNMAPYIRECMDSVVKQTLKDIEIICVDAGSTDGTLEILREYAAKDERIHLLLSDKKSYGYQMNLGMDAARGEYMGIVETDDFAEPDMFETLYCAAEAEQLDMAKAGFFSYYAKQEQKNIPEKIASGHLTKKVFCPATDLKQPLLQAKFFAKKPTIWSAIYRLEFLRQEQIRFLETPGASYQDTGFNFKVLVLAKRVRLLEKCLLHYRRDNETSSVNSPGKIYCVVDEYVEMERFLAQRPCLREEMEGIKNRMKLDTYRWNYWRLHETLREEFVAAAAKEFADDMAKGLCREKYYTWAEWHELSLLIRDPQTLHRYKQAVCRGIPCQTPEDFNEPTKEKIRRYLQLTYQHYFFFGWWGTLEKVIGKLRTGKVKDYGEA